MINLTTQDKKNKAMLRCSFRFVTTLVLSVFVDGWSNLIPVIFGDTLAAATFTSSTRPFLRRFRQASLKSTNQFRQHAITVATTAVLSMEKFADSATSNLNSIDFPS